MGVAEDLVGEGVFVEDDEDDVVTGGNEVEPLKEAWVASERLDVGRVCIGMVIVVEVNVVGLWLHGLVTRLVFL